MTLNIFESGQPIIIGDRTIQISIPQEIADLFDTTQYNYDELNRGVYPTTGPKSLPSQDWVQSTDIDAPGTTGIGLTDLYAIVGTQDEILGLSRSDGSEEWAASWPNSGSANEPESYPTRIGDNMFFFGEQIVRGFSIDDGSAGPVNSDIGDYGSEPTQYSFMEYDDDLFIQDEDGITYRINGDDGSLVWSFDWTSLAPADGVITASVATDGTWVYFTNSTGGQSFFGRLDISNGAIDGPYLTGLGTSVQVTTGGGIIVGDTRAYMPTTEGTIMARNLSDATQSWEVLGGSENPIVGAYNGSRVIVTTGGVTNNLVLYSLDPSDGSQDWSFDTGENDTISDGAFPVIADGIIYFADETGEIWAVDISDGSQIFNLAGVGVGTLTNIQVGDGALFLQGSTSIKKYS